MALLEVKNLRTSFFTDAGEVKAVNGVSFNLERGKVLGIVGESGSGKSVTAYSIMQILAPTAKINPESSIKLDGMEIVKHERLVERFFGFCFRCGFRFCGSIRCADFGIGTCTRVNGICTRTGCER